MNLFWRYLARFRSHFQAIRQWHWERRHGAPGVDFDDPGFKLSNARIMLEEDAEKYSAFGFRVDFQLALVDEGDVRIRMPAGPDRTGFLHECCDSVIVTEGVLALLGDDYDGARRAIQRANDLKPSERNEAGKIVKGSKYVKPKIAKFVNRREDDSTF